MQMTITQDTARDWLDATKRNRRVLKNTVNVYASDMKSGRWRADLAPAIMVGKDGGVIDGQHRLHALLSLPKGSVLDSEIRLIDDPTAIQVVDTGRPRGLTDSLVIKGHGTRSAILMGTMLSTSAWWGVGKRPTHFLSRSRQIEWMETNPNTEKAVETANTMTNKHRMVDVPSGAISTLYDIASYGTGPDTVVEFFDVFTKGTHGSETLGRAVRIILAAKNPKNKAGIGWDAIGFMLARVYTGWLVGEEMTRIYARRNAVSRVPGFVEWQEERWRKFLEVTETPDDLGWDLPDD